MKIHFPPGDRVQEFQPVRAERHISDIQLTSCHYAFFASIFQITQQGHSSMRHLGTDLMKTPRFKTDIRQGNCVLRRPGSNLTYPTGFSPNICRSNF